MSRVTLESCVKQKPVPSFHPSDPELLRTSGCFITLRKKGALRGCVGAVKGEGPLFEEVVRLTKAAALQDFRFKPVQPEELQEIRIEISILSSLERIHSWDQIEVGKHGIYLYCQNRNGVFLPEVAAEMNWTAEEFVRRCAVEKANIPESDWQTAEFYRFTAEKVKE